MLQILFLACVSFSCLVGGGLVTPIPKIWGSLWRTTKTIFQGSSVQLYAYVWWEYVYLPFKYCITTADFFSPNLHLWKSFTLTDISVVCVLSRHFLKDKSTYLWKDRVLRCSWAWTAGLWRDGSSLVSCTGLSHLCLSIDIPVHPLQGTFGEDLCSHSDFLNTGPCVRNEFFIIAVLIFNDFQRMYVICWKWWYKGHGCAACECINFRIFI